MLFLVEIPGYFVLLTILTKISTRAKFRPFKEIPSIIQGFQRHLKIQFP